ncbi:nucleoside phosphorylase [Chloroflexi bacterium TSY]|nr:nucleoside phosphorylase [Chloroflexi bacterium TSY]
MQQQYPILEYDSDPQGIIDYDMETDSIPGMPEHCVLCFFGDVFEHFLEQALIKPFTTIGTEMGEHPIYHYEVDGRTVALLHQGVGASLAAFLLEGAIEFGARKFIACGGAGVLDPTIAMGHILVPTAAVRDEGTSYHYLPPAREVEPTSTALTAIEDVLKKRNVEYLLTKTWSTDGFFREAKGKAALRKSEGCLAVEMEAAAMFAVARFRGVELGQLLYSGDSVDPELWEDRDWMSNWTVREMLVALAAEACLAL